MSEQKPYIVSARKYRPATFKTVVGQRALTATLKNAIDSGRLAQAYLFCGPRGVGKTSCARIFAKTINCLSPTPDGEACGECESCKAIERGNSFNLVELDAASNNSVDDIRSITEQVNVPPQTGRYRVFIIDEVHMLSNAAFNAFLKTLEEPPKYVVFILATTEKHKVIPTILSRCQIYDFKRITINDMIDHLEYVASEEGITAERDALGIIAQKADGAMRDALSIFDQVAASSRGNVTYASTIDNLNVLDYDYYFRMVDAFREGNIPGALLVYKEIRDKGFDSLFMVNGLAAHVRDLMVAADPRTASLLETSDEIAARYTQQAQTLPAQWYYAAMRLLSDCDLNYRTASSKRLLVELTLIRLCQLLKPPTPPFDAIDRREPLGDPTRHPMVSSGPAPAYGRPPQAPQASGAQASSASSAQGAGAAYSGQAPSASSASAAQASSAPTQGTAAQVPLTGGTHTPLQGTPASSQAASSASAASAAAASASAASQPYPAGAYAGGANQGAAASASAASQPSSAGGQPGGAYSGGANGGAAQGARVQPQQQMAGQTSGHVQKRRPSTIRLSEAAASVDPNAGMYRQRTKPIDHDRFMEAWGEFIARNPQLHILVSAMRSAQPTRSGDTSYSIIVDHPAQLQAFDLSMARLLEYLRNTLENDLLTLKVEVNTAPVENKMLLPKEFLRQAVADNSALAGFLSALDAELE